MATKQPNNQIQDKPVPPKKPLSAYFLYTNEVREKFKIKYPDKKIIELTKLMSEGYRALSEKERQAYEDRAKKLKEDYEKEITAYVGKYGALPKKERKSPDQENKKKVKPNPKDEDTDKANQKREKTKDNEKNPKVKVGNLNKEKK